MAISLADLARPVHPARAHYRALALLEAYFDESGMHGQARAMVVAGAVGLPDQWRFVEGEWSRHLGALGLESFHMSPCQRGKGAFGGFSLEQRSGLIISLARALVEGGVTIVGSAVVIADWTAMDAPTVRERFAKPYNLAFEHCIQQINSWSADHADGESVALVFAQHQEFAKRSAEVGVAYEASKEHGSQVGSITFVDARVFGMAQAADMIAYETYKWAEQMIDANESLRPVMGALGATGRMKGGLYDAEALATLGRRGPIGVL